MRFVHLTGLTLACLLASPALRAQDGDEDEGAMEVGGEDDLEGGEFSFGDTADLGGNSPGAAAPPAADLERPPPVNRGSIVGVLRDSRTGEPVMEAKVSVPGTPHKTFTDLEGRYRLDLPPGTYELRFFEGMHQPARTTGLVVEAGQTLDSSVRLEPLEGQVQEIEIVAKVEKDRLEGQLLSRQRAAATGDIIGRAEIAKTPDSNAAEAAKRVVGATVVGGRFVYVRGLGERYSNALLDGAPLPSPEPDRAAVPLDLFPVDVIDNITIVKTFTPDMPGDFAGGSVQIETRSIPDDVVATASAKAGYNTRATFRDRLDYDGSRGDWLGYDSGQRQLPDAVPDDTALRPGTQPDGSTATRADFLDFARALNSSMRWRTDAFTPPNHSGSLVLGNGWKLSEDGKLGAIAALGYGRSYDLRVGRVREFVPDRDSPVGYTPQVDYAEVTEGEMAVRWGAFGSVAYSPNPDHEVQLVGFHSQLANDFTQRFSGHSTELNQSLTGLRLRFVSRGLDVGRLTGAHEFDTLNHARLNWSTQVSRATRDEPDTRDVAFVTPGRQSDFEVLGDADSGRHFFSNIVEQGIAGTLDWTQPVDLLQKAKLKFGALGGVRRRDFDGRRFQFHSRPGVLLGCNGSELEPGCPDQVFDPAGLADDTLRMDENTQSTDGYRSALDVFAGYVMSDIEVFPRLRLVVGERVESTHQLIEPNGLGTGDAEGARLDSVDILPSAGLIYSLGEKSKLRAGASSTLARPQLRELAPFAFNDYYGGRVTVGNPDLELTRITNLDLRLEHFPTLREVAAVSLFYKHFVDPIEQTLVPTGGSYGTVTYVNTPGADLFGVELEARKELGFVTNALEDFSAIGNLTLATSRIQVEQTGNGTITSLGRPLMNQAPWVINLALDYDNEDTGTAARVAYNVNGPYIHEVGAGGVPDAYRQPEHLVDVTASQAVGDHFSIKAGVENLLDTKVLITQGKRVRPGNARNVHRPGAVAFVGVSYAY